ncbi:hypothetical protein [Bradyrhizobium icense]|uniref:Uncharacterized protein n=1 Tax=Bradyrhizobium icense TaxID=1274631 RepID=A0A1B1UB25_9BRAD|nr:hypothetical protein [Bradyrhizobium icense]ANV99865.1 hypothetical protein LMTR13_06445 [Bradyrhizobium icense]
MPLCRALGDGLWEVRTSLPGNRIARFLFSVRQGKQASKLLLRHCAQVGATILQDLNLKEREVLPRALSKMHTRLAANGGLFASHDS